MTTTGNIHGLILAGGAGSRVGGRDKGLLEWRGKPLVQWVAQSLRPQVNTLYISCNRNQCTYRSFADHVISDQPGPPVGPLAGLRALPAIPPGDYLLVVPCDTPLVPATLGTRLMETLGADNALAVCYAEDQINRHYLHALLKSECLHSLEDYLVSGHRSVRGWYATLQAAAVDFSDMTDAFSNLNTLQPDC
ncbi:molybdenum cofactor guanylyltransferase [Kineobactrum sediminis]|uniref:Molybdenum cofactor guanylyltransferase n=1 Tax=Kineobactrum sediminis TaxID=1905677 RepID=A0A2N5Y470_9GAMM|nr:molybdenum cofactor guanylyltransferase MobA [Kineobactrum sediminis]PLW83168.1 molybdenum cofactor guanylyltransferase [Kineobactrum sediminis]